MIFFFRGPENIIYAAESGRTFTTDDTEKLSWLFNGKLLVNQDILKGPFIGPRKEMVTPWSTNAVEITLNMGIESLTRIEAYLSAEDRKPTYDPMLQSLYPVLNQDIFTIKHPPDPIKYIKDIAAYNIEEGLALSDEEISYLNEVSKKLDRNLTDSEVFGFSQVNSEHCRHKIFNGKFILNGREMSESLFELIKKTSEKNPKNLISAYKDNVAFLRGPVIEQFAPARQDIPDYFVTRKVESVISLKAETHNFPTTVEPFNGASTGTGGEIRDRMAGGKGSFPLAGTAVYMTSYTRLEPAKSWEKYLKPRKWLYQSPVEILIKASNGASDFGNKFGQPLICGSVLTFEHVENNRIFGFDKVIMLAGGVGYGHNKDSLKDDPEPGDQIILLGGDNYRIGMGGGAVSSVATGEYANTIELNAVQRANPEMQKRVYNAIRALSESDINVTVSIHDHGAGGHLNCFSELVEKTGGEINLEKLPVGDPTLSAKEIIGNESQERMGLILKQKDIGLLKNIADRERAPLYQAGQTTGNRKLTFINRQTGEKPIDWDLEYMFGNPPRTVIEDQSVKSGFKDLNYHTQDLEKYIEQILQLEAVACKDWLTNKVDRSVTGRIAKQQTCGKLQLPLNNLGVVALDYLGQKGIATAIGHAPVPALIDPAAGSMISVLEALTNIIWAPVRGGLNGISLSANWMWPAKNPGEDARLYHAVEAISNFAIALGLNIPTGKDSLSMTQKYPDGKVVFAPGTVIISAAGEVTDIRKVISPALIHDPETSIYYIDITKGEFELGGSSFAQLTNRLGAKTLSVRDTSHIVNVFNTIQQLVEEELILAGHDVSAGGLITSLLEMTFPDNKTSLKIDLSPFAEKDPVKILFSEKPALIVQVRDRKKVETILDAKKVSYFKIGNITADSFIKISDQQNTYSLPKYKLRDVWFRTSYQLDCKQTELSQAESRFKHYSDHSLDFKFLQNFTGHFSQYLIDNQRKKTSGIRAAIIREKGVNGDREMAYSLYLAGFDVKDVHMTDLISGRETLEEVNFIVFVGGFSNSDVLGSAKGWAGAFLYNRKAKIALERFYQREDTLSLGVCNGCQLMVNLNLVYPDLNNSPKMMQNRSGKFESAFLSVDILPNNSIMLKSLAGSSLGIWVAHGEGRFHLTLPENEYNIPAKFSRHTYPANPNGSDYDAASICSKNGRHLAIMPHLERSIFPWQWGYYPEERNKDMVTPWIEAFVNARNWIENKI